MIDGGPPVRGGARSTIELLRQLTRWTPTVFVNCRGELSERAEAVGLRTVVLDVGTTDRDEPMRKHLGQVGHFQRRLLAHLRRERFSIVHCDYELIAWVVPATGVARVPLTIYQRALFTRPRPVSLRLKMWAVSRVFVLTTAQAEVMRRYHPRPAVVARNSLSPEFLHAAEAARAGRPDLPSGRITIIGGVTPAKRLAEFLGEVVPRLEQRCSIEVVGVPQDPAYWRRCQAAAEATGVEVRFTDWVEDICSVLQRSDLVVVPSRLEGIPRVVLEAQAAGVPVVCAAFPGADESVAEGIGGHVARDWRHMAELVDLVLGDGDRWRRLRDGGPPWVEATFDGAASASAVEAVWDELAAPGRR
jgi:glycosyltransferase involved in cell wall biosynthesis